MPETSELPSLPEKPNTFRAYSGLTRRQFGEGATVIEGRVYFDKEESTRQNDDTYYTRDLATAFVYACDRARELKDSPIVISGLLDVSCRVIKLESGILFPVDAVWTEAKGKYWEFVCNDLADGNPQKVLEEGLKRLDPLELLRR